MSESLRWVVWIGILGLAVRLSSSVVATGGQTTDTTVSGEEFDRWMREYSNWGRWGDDDELGTINLITPQKRVQAAELVRDGITVSLSRRLRLGSQASF